MLYIRLKNLEGEAVSFSKAELFLSTRDYWKTLTLTVESDLLVVSLDKNTMPPPDYEHAQGDWRDCRLIIEADGYVTVQSRTMHCIGMVSQGGPATQAIVDFPNGPRVEVPQGETREIELTLRKPQERYLRFVDDDQEPIQEVTVTTVVFYSNDNHCGWWINDHLAKGTTDQDGRVLIPDGDFEYGLRFDKPLYLLREPESPYPMSFIGYLSSTETVVKLHRMTKQKLEMLVTKDGQPLANATLSGDWIFCPCWCYGGMEIATTDENGRILLTDFYPEEWYSIFFWPDGAEWYIWEADPAELSGDEITHVELPDWND